MRVGRVGRHRRLFVCTLSPGALASSSRAESYRGWTRTARPTPAKADRQTVVWVSGRGLDGESLIGRLLYELRDRYMSYVTAI